MLNNFDIAHTKHNQTAYIAMLSKLVQIQNINKFKYMFFN